MESLKGKMIVIFGDSYSTFEGCIPDGYPAYYYRGGREGATDVRAVEETWWARLCKQSGAEVLLNDSWSGSTVGYTGYNGDCSTSSSFIYRLRCLKESGFFLKNSVDTVCIFGGTNDSWADAPLGEMKFSDWEKKDLYFVLPALAYFAYAVKETLPNAEIVIIINTELKDEIADCFKAVAARYGLKAAVLCDIDKECGHPTVKGMAQICEQVLAVLAC